MTVKVRSSFPAKLWASNVIVAMPVPEQTARATFNVSAGEPSSLPFFRQLPAAGGWRHGWLPAAPMGWHRSGLDPTQALPLAAPPCTQTSSVRTSYLPSPLTPLPFIQTAGKAKYDPKRHALVWKLKRFVGETEHTLSATVELIATTREKKPWGRPPMSLSFQVGLCVCVFFFFCWRQRAAD